MSEKRYEHQIFHIAHPLVRKLIQQAIDVRKFRVIYPVLFDNLKNTREEVTEQLILELKGPVQEYFEYKTMVELEEQLAIILSGRRLVDQALGYIQTGKIHLHDEFLVKNILTKQQLTDIFEKIRLDFWSNFIKFIPEFSNAPESIQNHSATLMKVLHTKGWYLPNLLPAWSVEELFVDYITVFLKYNKYKTSHQDSGKQYPTKDELKESLKNIIGYDQPLFNDHGTFIDFYTNEQGQRSSNYLGVNIDLDGSLHSLPYILSEFIVSYSSRWIDYSRKGQKGGLGEGDDIQLIAQVNNTILKMLDKLTNRNTALDRADSLISGLLALLYFDGIFSQFTITDQTELEDLNIIEMFRHFKYLKDSEERVKINLQAEQEIRQQIFASLTPYTIDDLIQKIVKIFEGNEDVKLELEMRSGKKPTHLVFTIEHEKLSCELDVKGMKQKIKRMLGHFFANEEKRLLKDKSDSLLGLSPIFTPLFKKSKLVFL